MLCKELKNKHAELEAYNAPAGEDSVYPRKSSVGGLLRYLQDHMPIGGHDTKGEVAKLRLQMSGEDVAYYQRKHRTVTVIGLCVEWTYAQLLVYILKETTRACPWVSQSGHPLTLGVTSAHVIMG